MYTSLYLTNYRLTIVSVFSNALCGTLFSVYMYMYVSYKLSICICLPTNAPLCSLYVCVYIFVVVFDISGIYMYVLVCIGICIALHRVLY